MKGHKERQKLSGIEPGSFQTDYEAGKDVLTYAGSDAEFPENPINSCNRKKVKCEKFCRSTSPLDRKTIPSLTEPE